MGVAVLKQLLEFASQYPVRKVPKGELILVEGEVPKCAHVIKKGVVKVYAITSEGVEKPINFDNVGESFPVGWIFGKINQSPYYYDAFSDVELYCIPQEEYIDFLKSRPDIMYQAFDYFVERYLFFQMRVNALEQSKAVDKIIHTLHFLALRFGKEIAPHKVRLTLPLSQQELANIMGLTRETTGIELKKLVKLGIIKQDRQKLYTIYTDRLDQVLDTDYGMAAKAQINPLPSEA